MTMSVTIEATGEQGRWDATFQKLGRSCPAQRADEAPLDYLRRLSRVGRKYIPAGEEIARVSFAQLPDAVVPKFAEMMRERVEANLFRTDNMRPGELRPVLITDENTGMQQRYWIGKTSFVRDPAYGHRDARRVDCIRNPTGNVLYRSARSQRALDAMARGY
jgi:hypothetical protein